MLSRVEIESTFTRFIVRGLGTWGKGESLKEAKANCLKQGRSKGQRLLAHWGTEDIECLSDGSVTASNMVFLGEI